MRAAHPELGGHFGSAVRKARAVGLGKLWLALAREQLGGVRATSTACRAVLSLPDGTRLTAPSTVMEPFADHPPGLTLTVDGRGAVIDHPAVLLETVAAARTPDDREGDWSGLYRELAESVANHALALVGEHHRRERLGLREGAPGAVQWAAGQARACPSFSPLALFEQSVVDGHPLHPCARIRGGMTAADLFTYAPEWAETVPVGIVAVSASGSPRHPSTSGLLRRFHPQAAAAALAHLERLGRNPGDYDLVPAHPWQIERRLPARYPAALAEGRIVVAPEACIAARPLLSLRTFAPASDRRSPHLKTSVDVRLTTAVRGVSPAAARNGPLLSRLIAHVCHEEGGFGGRFGVLAELAGGGYRPGPGEPADAAGALSAVVRESPEAGIAGGGVALPTAALAARSPASGRLVLAEVLDEVARGHGGSRADAGARFLSAWCVCALPALLTLLSRWGIGLEAHGENLVAVLADGLAVRMLYRDFGGVRVSPSRLRNQGLRLPALTGALPTDDETELRGKFLFPLLETNLGQIVAALVQAGGCDEERLWRLVARCCRTTYAALAADPRIREQCRRDEEALFGARLPVKAMLRTQLEGTPHDARWVTATNPLAATA